MTKNIFTKVNLAKGEMNVYDFGKLKLHAYKTNDFIDDEVFVVEKDGAGVIIESPCFFDNNKELEQYLADNNIKPEGMLIAYHMAGGTFLPAVKKYATNNAEEYGTTGGGKALIDNFTGAFGNVFDKELHKITDYLEEGKVNICGIEFVITQTSDAYDIEIPEINAVYTHMMGHDCHSIVAGNAHAQGIIAQLQGYIAKGYDLVLTSHYTPEDLKDVQTKIDYMRELKTIAGTCENPEEFITAVKKKYPDYSGENYLNMTAGFFFG